MTPPAGWAGSAGAGWIHTVAAGPPDPAGCNEDGRAGGSEPDVGARLRLPPATGCGEEAT